MRRRFPINLYPTEQVLLRGTCSNDLRAKYSVTPIVLRRDQWYADHQNMPVDVRHDQMRWIEDRSQPAMVPGERIEVHVPFEGEAELFYARANTFTMNLPRAVAAESEPVLRYDCLT
jgi:hypothetical protein